MLPRKQGSIVNIASMSGIFVIRGLSHILTLQKLHHSNSLGMEWSDQGILVNATDAGYTATPMNVRPDVAGQVKRFEAHSPLGCMGTVDELIGVAIFFSSQAASFCTGVDLVVDGGFVCRRCFAFSVRLNFLNGGTRGVVAERYGPTKLPGPAGEGRQPSVLLCIDYRRVVPLADRSPESWRPNRHIGQVRKRLWLKRLWLHCSTAGIQAALANVIGFKETRTALVAFIVTGSVVE